MFLWRLGIVIGLVGLLQVGFWRGWLRRQPGPQIVEHGHLIVLLLTPWGWAWVLGGLAYVDDLWNHRQGVLDPDYRSPLHRLTVRLRLWDGLWWLAQRRGWGWTLRLWAGSPRELLTPHTPTMLLRLQSRYALGGDRRRR